MAKRKGVSLSVGRGEKSKKGGLTAKGRAKYNRATGSNLQAPVTEKNPTGKRAATDGAQMRRLAVELGIPFITTITGADAAIKSLEEGENNYLMPINKK